MSVCKRVGTRFAWAPYRPAGACALALTLAACAGLPPTAAPPASPQTTAAQRVYRETIEMAGRLSVRYQKNDKEEALHGSFTWSQTPQRTLVTMLSPLGQTIASIEATPDSATLIQAGQAPLTANNVDKLAAEAFGWPLPVSGLRNWLQGFATDSAGQPFVATPHNANNTVITPDGWRIQYLGWVESETPAMPKRVDLQRGTAEAGEVTIRIIIDSKQAAN